LLQKNERNYRQWLQCDKNDLQQLIYHLEHDNFSTEFNQSLQAEKNRNFLINAKKVVKYMFDASLHYYDWQLQKCENNLQEINETISDLKKDEEKITNSMNKYFKKWVEEFIVSRKQAFDVLLQSIKNQLESERREQQKIEAKKQVIKNNRRLIYEQLVFMEKEQTELQNLNSCHLE
jgi:hypothetical protein